MKYSTRCSFQYICSGNILKNNLWLNLHLAWQQLYQRKAPLAMVYGQIQCFWIKNYSLCALDHWGLIEKEILQLSYLSEISIYLSSIYYYYYQLYLLYVTYLVMVTNQGALRISSSIALEIVKKQRQEIQKKLWFCDDFFIFKFLKLSEICNWILVST